MARHMISNWFKLWIRKFQIKDNGQQVSTNFAGNFIKKEVEWPTISDYQIMIIK